MPMQAVYQPVIRIRQAAVGGETGGPGMLQQRGQARMLADPETSPQGVGAQAFHCQRHQHLAVESQQRHGIAGEQLAQRRQQAAITLAVVQLARQVGHQGNQGFQQRVSGHFDYSKSL